MLKRYISFIPHSSLLIVSADYLSNSVRVVPSFSSIGLTRYKHSHQVSVIPTLPEAWKEAAIDSYASALKVVFIAQAGIAVLCLACSLGIQEKALPYVFIFSIRFLTLITVYRGALEQEEDVS